MKKHELLQKAMKDYPNGTKLNHKLSGTFNCELPYFIDGTNSVSDRNGRCLFASSEATFSGWAEIVTDKPKEIEQQLYFGQVAFINPNNSEIRIIDGGKEVLTLSFGDINDLQVNINNALKTLNNEN